MLTTVAVLVIVLGLMASLARHVRERAAVVLTKDLLRRLDQVTADYAARHGAQPPPVTGFPPIPSAPGQPAKRSPDRRAITSALAATDTTRPDTSSYVRTPVVRDLPPPPDSEDMLPDKRAFVDAALNNNKDFVAVLKAESRLTGGALSNMPASVYDEVILRDAWGSPIVFMPTKHPWVGTAPGNRPFFFSAGPDRLYLTQDDNLYSYEDAGTGQREQ